MDSFNNLERIFRPIISREELDNARSLDRSVILCIAKWADNTCRALTEDQLNNEESAKDYFSKKGITPFYLDVDREIEVISLDATQSTYQKIAEYLKNPRGKILMSSELGVRAVPTALLYHEGNEIGRIVGAYSAEDLFKEMDKQEL